MKKINAFISNNIIIVIFVIALLIGLLNYVLYPYLVESEYRMVEVPVAKTEIAENTEISEDLIDYASVPLSAVRGEIETDLIGKYVLNNSKIVKGGFFYKDLIGDKASMAENKISSLKDTEIAISIPVNSITSTNDLINKDQYVDLYFDGTTNINGYETKVFGMVAENIRVIDTFNANSISTEEGNKSYIVLAVNDETYGYLKRALIIGNITPAIKYDSYEESHFNNEYYSIEDTRYLIDKECKVYKRNLSDGF